MLKVDGASVELVANHFVNYIFDEFGGARHVRRVASWIGLILLGIERIGGQSWRVPRTRQLWFAYAGRTFKARYNHKAGPRGGIEIIEVLPGPGAPEGKTVATISSLKDAQDFYSNAPQVFQKFGTQQQKPKAAAS